jgi:hypothetical protein
MFVRLMATTVRTTLWAEYLSALAPGITGDIPQGSGIAAITVAAVGVTDTAMPAVMTEATLAGTLADGDTPAGVGTQAADTAAPASIAPVAITVEADSMAAVAGSTAVDMVADTGKFLTGRCDTRPAA